MSKEHKQTIHKAFKTDKQIQKEVNTNWNGLLFLSIKLGEKRKINAGRVDWKATSSVVAPNVHGYFGKSDNKF